MARIDRSIASPLCIFEGDCPKQGRATFGPPKRFASCVNRTIRCVTCGATGEESVSLEGAAKAFRDRKVNRRPGDRNTRDRV